MTTRMIALLLTASLLAGCINPARMCGIERTNGWIVLKKAPANEGNLLALVEKDPARLVGTLADRNYWFKRNDEFLLCRADPEVASDGCFSAGWQLTRQNDVWAATKIWEGLCTG
jgi:hypothetical protein